MPGCPGVIGVGAMERLAAHDWPGNVREMRNVLERALMAARGAAALGPEHLPAELARRASEAPKQVLTREPLVGRTWCSEDLKWHTGSWTSSGGISSARFAATAATGRAPPRSWGSRGPR